MFDLICSRGRQDRGAQGGNARSVFSRLSGLPQQSRFPEEFVDEDEEIIQKRVRFKKKIE